MFPLAGVFASVDGRSLLTSSWRCCCCCPVAAPPLAALPLLAILELASLLSARLFRPNEIVRRVTLDFPGSSAAAGA
eukprot:2732375-Prymnesium_polylepis.1